MGFEPEVKSAFDKLAQWHSSSFGENIQFDVGITWDGDLKEGLALAPRQGRDSSTGGRNGTASMRGFTSTSCGPECPVSGPERNWCKNSVTSRGGRMSGSAWRPSSIRTGRHLI